MTWDSGENAPMPTAGPAELARSFSGFDANEVDQLERLVASWGLLADLCFSDLLLWGRTDHDTYAVLAHVRPTTSQTIYRTDWTRREFSGDERPLVASCFTSGEIVDGEIDLDVLAERVRVLCIPMFLGARTIAVLSRESTPSVGRQPGELEQTYVGIFNRFARMIVAGSFPFREEMGGREVIPRVGDGLVLLDAGQRVEYSSPNGVSALVRIGAQGGLAGMKLAEVGVDDTSVRRAFRERRPVTVEIERTSDTTVMARCVPLLEGDECTGAIVLLRDISELRSRDRLLMSKDATIREIHHRVKNNLQTISSLLRLQGRRLDSLEAKGALEESVRRIRSIALVHETLSREASDDVPFIEIVRPLVRMAEEGLSSPERPLRFKVSGDAGRLPATIATPLAVVLTELLQNVVDHAYPPEEVDQTGQASVLLDSTDELVRVAVVDDGVGLPDGFSLAETAGLGLQIVRTLVTTELAGTIEMRRADGPPGRPGTRVDMAVPVGELLAREADVPRPAGERG
jgi:two-component sensor histidine kinase